jgi:hypothetical protein
MIQAFADTFLSRDPMSSPNRTTRGSGSAKKPAFSEAEFNRQAALIEKLQADIAKKDAQLASMGGSNVEGTVFRKHELAPIQHVISDKGRETVKLGTRGSISTANVLQALEGGSENSEGHDIAKKFIKIFQNPVDYASYLQSPDFASDVVALCEEVRVIFEAEDRCIDLPSPCYVFGDIHGNLEDLHFFADNVWKLGMDLTAGHFLFLGDYVDRGLNCLECIAYLFGLKLLYPKKMFMLRGNHETRDVNGWEDHYGDRSFLYQCKDRFGVELGELVWEEVNAAFDRLPLAAVIDRDIFCIHGGIPRIIEGTKNELEAIESVPHVAGVMPAYKHGEF